MSLAATSIRTSELAAIVGDKYVIEASSQLAELSIDGVRPLVAVTPASVEEISAVLSYAYERDLVVAPAGGFVHQEIGRIPGQIDIVMRLERLNSIEHYDPGDLTIGVGAGSTIGEIDALLRDQRQLLPIDIAHADRATIGGAMSVAAHGPLKHLYGGVREFCLGVRYVTADGKAAKAGARVVKNVAGFDVMKLLIGSYGSLAVITSASFKLFPAPPLTRTFLCQFASAQEAIRFRDSVVHSPLSPMGIEIFSPFAYDRNSWTLAVRAGGSERVLARYASELGSGASRTLDALEEQRFWAEMLTLGEQSPVVISVSVPPSGAGQVLAEAERIASDHQLGVKAWGRIAIASLLFAFDGGMAESYVTTVERLRHTLPRDSSAVVSRCPAALKSDTNVWGASPTDMNAMKLAKRALNPKDTLNRGRFLL